MQMQFGRPAEFTTMPRMISLYQHKLEWTLFSSVAYASTTIKFPLFQEHLKDGFLLNVLKKLLLQSQETVRNLDRGLLVIWSAFKELCRLIFGYFFLK